MSRGAKGMGLVKGNVELAVKIRELRVSRGLTLRQLEAETGLSNPYLSQMEHGYSMPGIRPLVALAAFYGITLDDLAGHMVDEERE